MKLKMLYHGSSRKIKKLNPKKAHGLNRKEDRLLGVYATRIKNFAITMALISSRGIKGKTSIDMKGKKIKGIISQGWPKQKYIYLYILDPKEFRNIPKGSHQYISQKSIIPIKENKLLVKDYIYLIKKK